ncbi:recombinase family protein [Paucimonas lemoignei]|uniref:recombinase family protein n=1 Tax=Paucimonas lemoignei TaxID=29443 RepID=UPI003C706E26
MTQKTAIIYLRVSSVQQAREELPIESQLQFAYKKARDLDALVIRVFTDNGVSGRTDQRPEFQEAVKYCELYKPDYFIAWDTARFARNRIDAALYKRDLREIGTDVVYVSVSIDSKTDEGWMLEALMEVFDENTSRRISKDTRRSMIKNATEGFFNGGRVPYGYQTVPDGRRKRVVIKEEEAAVVREIFHMCTKGMGAHAIAVAMNDAGHTNHGRKWVKSSVIYMLKNQIYAGYTVFNRRRHHANKFEPEENWIRTKSHPEIIDEELFMRTQEIISGRAPGEALGSPKSNHRFTGMLFCGQCKSPMHIESGSGRSKTYFYYRCSNAKQHQGCTAARINATALDEYLSQVILDQILTRDRVKAIIRDIEESVGTWWKDRESRRAAVVAEIRDLEKKQKNLFDVLEMYGKDTPNLADVTKRLREIKSSLETLEMKLAELESEQDPVMNVSEEDIHTASDVLRTMVIDCENQKAARSFFSSFVEKVTLEKERVVIKYNPSKILNHERIVVHSKESWLPDLDSNQGPAD